MKYPCGENLILTYFGSVEQQGRLTLHLHILIWIKNNLTPQEMRDRIMNQDAEFLKSLVEYLESLQVGEFTKPASEIEHDITQRKATEPDYVEPWLELPKPPPEFCECERDDCHKCKELDAWWEKYIMESDQIPYRLNHHKCQGSTKSQKKRKRMDLM